MKKILTIKLCDIRKKLLFERQQNIQKLIDEIVQNNNFTRKKLRDQVKNAFLDNSKYFISKKDIKRLCNHSKAKHYFFVPIGCVKIIEYFWDTYNEIAKKYKTELIGYIDCVIGKTVFAVIEFADIYMVGDNPNLYQEQAIINAIKGDLLNLRRKINNNV